MSIVPYTSKQMGLAEVGDVAKMFAASGYFQDAADVAKAYTKILAGQEVGIGPMQAMTGIHIVKGKPTFSGPLVGALIKRSGRYDYRIVHLDDTRCELAFFQDGEQVGTSEFSIEDAQKAGLTSNQTWRTYPRNMLFARAITNGARWHCPDVFGGPVYTPEELGAVVDAEGNVVDDHNDTVAAETPHVEAPVELAAAEQVEQFWALVEKVAAADPEEKHSVAWWRRLADMAAEKKHNRPVAHLDADELAGLAREFQEHYGKLKGSGEADPVGGSTKRAEGDHSPSPRAASPDNVSPSEPPQPGTDGPSGAGSPSESAPGAEGETESLFKAPAGPRGSKRKEAA